MSLRALRSPVCFGGADGVVIVIGLVVTLTGQHHALWKAALGAGLAELVGMSSGAFLSDERAGWKPALANGCAAFAACTAPAIPYAVTGGVGAFTISLVLVAGVAAFIAILRPERGALAWIQTFGILVLAAAVCAAVSHI